MLGPTRNADKIIQDEQGSVLMWALLFSVIASGMIISHTTYLAANRREMSVRYEHVTLADTFARSGLTDALTWYQKQPTQPVGAFTPQLDPSGDPPLLDTLDPTIGLVREFEVRGNLWARYEVRKNEAFDVSLERGQETPGTVWDMGSRGFLFLKEDESKSFDESPNRVIATNYLRSEMRGIAILPPAQAAITTDDPVNLDIGPTGVVDGNGGPAITFPDTQPPPVSLPGTVSGTPILAPIVSYTGDVERVLSMHLDQYASIADYTIDLRETTAIRATDIAVGTETEGAALGGSGGDGGAPQGSLSVSSDSATASASGDEFEWWTDSGDSLSSGEVIWDWWAGVVDPSATASVDTTVDTDTATAASKTVADEFRWTTAMSKYVAGVGQPPLAPPSGELDSKAVYLAGWDTDGDGDAEVILDDTRPLSGIGLVVVNGDLIVTESNITRLKGVLYVTGDATIDGDFLLEGTLIVRGALKMGYGTNASTVRYDPEVVALLKKSMERYRLSKSIRPGWAR